MKNCFIKTFLIGTLLLGVLSLIGLTVTPVPTADLASMCKVAPDTSLAEIVKKNKERRVYYKITTLLPAYGDKVKPFNYVSWGYLRNPDGTLTIQNMNNGLELTISPPFTIQEQRAGAITRNP